MQGTFNWSNPKFLRLDLAPAAANLRDPESYEWDEFEIDFGLIKTKKMHLKSILRQVRLVLVITQ